MGSLIQLTEPWAWFTGCKGNRDDAYIRSCFFEGERGRATGTINEKGKARLGHRTAGHWSRSTLFQARSPLAIPVASCIPPLTLVLLGADQLAAPPPNPTRKPGSSSCPPSLRRPSQAKIPGGDCGRGQMSGTTAKGDCKSNSPRNPKSSSSTRLDFALGQPWELCSGSLRK